MKYWLLTTEYPPFFGGGIGTYCAVTAKMLSDKGHAVTVFVSDAAVSDIQENEKDGIRIIRFSTSRTNSSSFLGHVTNINYEFAHIIKHFIEKEGQPDIIESQEYQGIAYYLLQYKHLLFDWCRDVPVIITMHSPASLNMEYNHVPVYRYPNYWICEMEYFCLQAASHIISPSHYMLRELGKRFVLNNKNVEVIPNPFDEKLNNIKAIPTGKEANEIVFYGKLTVQKGAFKLLTYFKELWDKGFDRPLFLLGGQDIVYHPEGITMGDIIRKRYKKYIDQGLLKLENRIKPSEIGERLSSAELVIIPSNNDNLPYVVFEMMALGRILLVSKQGGHSEVIENGIDGFVFDHEEPETFFSQLDTILKLDDEQRKDIAARAIKKVEGKYGPDVIYERKIKLVEKLLQKKEGLPPVFPFIRNKPVEINNIPEMPLYTAGKLSIVVPYYNMGQYIDETIQSIQRCEFADKEILIINDGSTEALSLDKLNEYRHKENIKIIDVQNSGLAKARNLGAEYANGEFLAFLDADDTITPEYYTRAINIFNQYENVHFAGCWVQYFENSSDVWPAFMPEPPLILNHNTINSSSLVYKRAAFLSAGKNDPNMVFQGLEDYDSVIAMLSRGFGGVVIPEIMFNYRIRNNSMFREISKSKKLNLYQHISNKHKQFYATFATDLFNLLNANGPGILLDNPSLDYHLADRMPFGGKLSGRVIALIKRNRFVKTIAYKAYKMLKK